MKHITTIEQAKQFLNETINYLGLGFHPDNSFADYVDPRNNETLYSEEQANLSEEKLSDCFELFEEAGLDIYEYCLKQL